MNTNAFFSTRYALLDGAMGTQLQKKGLAPGQEPVLLNLTHPDWIVDIHSQYVGAGARVVYANTFGANPFKIHDEATLERVIRSGVALARQAAGDRALVALDVGPLGQLLEPTGLVSWEEAYAHFAKILSYGQQADLVVFETFTQLYELKAAVLAARETCDLPIFCSMSFEENGRTFTGTSVEEMALTLQGLGVSALGINCSLGPAQLLPVVSRLCRCADVPVFVKPNAGLPDPLTGAYDLSPEEFARQVCSLYACGARILGGCCGTSPAYIAALEKALSGAQAPLPRPGQERVRESRVCSATRTVSLQGPCIIGERINPTGKKKMKEALLAGDMDYLMRQAVEQAQAGAHILDVNVGLPGVDEAATMVRAVKAIQSVTDLPLQLDSSSVEALEAGLRVCNGRPIVNSVNGKKESLETVLPLVKKYGACVVGLTLDETGIPPKAPERFAIAQRIAAACDAYGIPRQDLFIDCLTLTVATDQANALETLKALKLCKEQLGVKTVLGVSNISFGLPNREQLNPTFLSAALAAGLDLPILNPNNAAMAGAVWAWRALAGWDEDCRDYVARYTQEAPASAPAPAQEPDLAYCLENGLVNPARQAAQRALEQTAPMELVNRVIVPALDRAGERFEKGSLFLPQLIQCAASAQAAFEVVGQRLEKADAAPKGCVVLATVKNDIHDIGKNIVRTLLENYGFRVVDLGKDVPPQQVVQATLENGAGLVGLSALMTTTVGSMAQTVELLKEHCPGVPVVVGGAVLTPEHARTIGADYYAKDAKATVDIAKAVFGE